jgi:hypothetical protein
MKSLSPTQSFEFVNKSAVADLPKTLKGCLALAKKVATCVRASSRNCVPAALTLSIRLMAATAPAGSRLVGSFIASDLAVFKSAQTSRLLAKKGTPPELVGDGATLAAMAGMNSRVNFKDGRFVWPSLAELRAILLVGGIKV